MSAIPAAKQKVYGVLKAAEALDGVTVSWGEEGVAHEEVVISGAQADREFRTIGQQPPPLDETYNIGLKVNVLTPQGRRDIQAVEDRAWEIADAVEAALRGEGKPDPAFFHRPARVEQDYVQTDKSQGVQIRITLTGKARI